MGLTERSLRSALTALEGEASRWPRDDEFRHAWLTAPIHNRLLEPARIRAVLVEVENALRSQRTEEPFSAGSALLDVDHILPDKWYEHWPLAGDRITEAEASTARFSVWNTDEVTPRIEAIRRREELKATIGNLTLLHYGVNRSLQHGPFADKRERLFAESNLHLNRELMRLESWDEASIEQRGRDFFEVARRIWRGPEA